MRAVTADDVGRPPQVLVVRHGETAWSRVGRHTGRTDVPLDEAGRAAARGLVGVADLVGVPAPGLVATSPLSRARETCALAGLEATGPAVVLDDLAEWDYGDYEGRTTPEIRTQRPGWSLWRDGVPGGERLEDVARRADAVLDRLRAYSAPVVLVAHGHLLRVVTARWLDLAPVAASGFVLGPARVGVLGWEHELPALELWNATVAEGRVVASGEP